jgi:hypothetical protein
MDLSPPSKAASCATTEELPNNIWNPKVHYHVHNSPSLVPIFSQINPVHTTPFYLLRFILILSTKFAHTLLPRIVTLRMFIAIHTTHSLLG